jgi:dihydrofolate reductase
MNRPKVSVYIAASVDGYIARKDGSLDWLECVGGSEEDYGFKAFVNSVDGVILGRKTYEVASSVEDWPYRGKKTVILSNSLQVVRKDAELYRGDLTQLLSQMHADGISHVWVDGGMTIAQFLSLRAVDAMIISVIPTILGSGIPLFQQIDQGFSCGLVAAQPYPSGLVQLRYTLH